MSARPTKRQLALRWIIGAVLCGAIAAIARGGGGELTAMQVEAVDPLRPFADAEELAERVRYSEPFEVEAPVLVVDAEGDADLALSLVEETSRRPPAVAETTLRVRGRARGRFAGVEGGRYRLRVVAEGRGPVRVRLAEGHVSPIWAAAAAALVLLPALLSTRQWIRGRVLG